MPLHINESWVDATRGINLGDSGVYETHFETPGEAFRACRREYGRCTGKVYVDDRSHDPALVRAIGWVFIQRVPYDDSPKTFLRETWVTLHDAPPEATRKHHYHVIGG